MGFEMDQETSGADPVRLFVFQMNFDSVVLFSYLWMLKDNLCCEYRCLYDPFVSPMYVFVSRLGAVTVALYFALWVLQLPCRGHFLWGHCTLFRQLHSQLVALLSDCFMMRLLCFLLFKNVFIIIPSKSFPLSHSNIQPKSLPKDWKSFKMQT